MCECPSQLPRTQPVHITAKRHKLGSQGMREVQIAFRVWLFLCDIQWIVCCSTAEAETGADNGSFLSLWLLCALLYSRSRFCH